MRTFSLTLLLITLCCTCQPANPDNPGTGKKSNAYGTIAETGFNYIYTQGTYSFECYRIPALVKTSKGTLLAFAEARKLRSNGDGGDINTVVRRSTDGGKTWTVLKTVWDDGSNTCGNPVPIADKDGTVHLLLSWNYDTDRWGGYIDGTAKDIRRVYYSKSTDDGLTWSKPVEITSSVAPEGTKWYATGPCHGIQLKNGPHAGRLISPDYFLKINNGKSTSHSQMSYSDDGGLTWHAGTPTQTKGGECCIAERQDGSLVMLCRSNDKHRTWAVSTDGGITWSEPVENASLEDPECQGSILAIGTTLYQSNAAHPTDRKNLTIKKSTDGGKTWSAGTLIYDSNSGYSDLVQISDTEIGILSEIGANRYTDGLSFKIINTADIR